MADQRGGKKQETKSVTVWGKENGAPAGGYGSNGG